MSVDGASSTTTRVVPRRRDESLERDAPLAIDDATLGA